MFDNLNSQINHIKEGRLRALAVTTPSAFRRCRTCRRSAETVPGYEAMAFFGISAPRNVPPAVLAKLNSEINAGLRDPKLKARIEDFGADPSPGTPEAFAKLVADETEKWAKVVKISGAKPE